MPAPPLTRRRVEFVLVPLVAAFCMAFIIGAIVLDRDGRPCPQPTWNNQLSLTLAGNATGVSRAAAVTACAGAECVPAAPNMVRGSGGNSSVLMHQNDGSWLLTLGAQAPPVITVRVFDRAGGVVASQSTALNWTRVSGDERCGGRMAGINVVLDVP